MTLIDIEDLKLRTREKEDPTLLQTRVGVISVGGPAELDDWAYRVDITDKQAVIGFKKHGTIGIDFLHNDGSDLPYAAGLDVLADFIASGRLLGGDAEIPREHVIRAITMIRDACGEAYGAKRCLNCAHLAREYPDITDGVGHWVEDCPHPLWSYEMDRRERMNERRGPDGWVIEDEEDDDE